MSACLILQKAGDWTRSNRSVRLKTMLKPIHLPLSQAITLLHPIFLSVYLSIHLSITPFSLPLSSPFYLSSISPWKAFRIVRIEYNSPWFMALQYLLWDSQAVMSQDLARQIRCLGRFGCFAQMDTGLAVPILWQDPIPSLVCFPSREPSAVTTLPAFSCTHSHVSFSTARPTPWVSTNTGLDLTVHVSKWHLC